jgi:hypothetical protein
MAVPARQGVLARELFFGPGELQLHRAGQVRRQVAHGISVRQIHRLAPKLPQRQT